MRIFPIALLGLLLQTGILSSNSVSAQTLLSVIQNITLSAPSDDSAALRDFSLCNRNGEKSILFSIGSTLHRVDLDSGEHSATSLSNFAEFANDRECTLVYKREGNTILEFDIETGDISESFDIPPEEGDLSGEEGDIAFDTTTGHLFVLGEDLTRTGGNPGLLEIDSVTGEILEAVNLPAIVGSSRFFTMHPETGEIFFLIHAENGQIVRLSSDGTFLELFSIPALPDQASFASGAGNGIAIDDETGHLFVSSFREDLKFQFLGLAPVFVTAVGKEWEQYE